MKLLVTGGAGFIGSNFIHYILKKYPDDWVFNLDKLTYAGNLDNLKNIGKNRRYKFVKGDICNRKIVDKVVSEVEVIVNFAAETHVDRSILGAVPIIKTNIFGTFNLLEAAKRYKIKKFVQISTDEVYGSIQNGSFNEKSLLDASSPYSSSKAAADLLALSYFKTFKVPVAITRSTNNFGPYQHPEKFIPLFITNLLENKKVPLYGQGANIRDWLYVEDNCRAIDLVLRRGQIGEVYNIGAKSEFTNLAVVKMLLKNIKKDFSSVEYVIDRPAHDLRYSLEIKKIKKLGWRPIYKFHQALQKTIKWYKDNEWWWKKIKSKSFKNYYQRQYIKRKKTLSSL